MSNNINTLIELSNYTYKIKNGNDRNKNRKD
jgi:hypothetical protein